MMLIMSRLPCNSRREHGWKAGDAYSALIKLNQSLTVMIAQKVPFW
jgi:hypothetical protein